MPLLLGRHHDFAKKCIAPRIVRLSWNHVKQEVTKLAQRAVGVGDVYAVLPSWVALFGPCIHGGKQLPPADGRIGTAIRLQVEFGVGAIAGKEIVKLWPAGAGVPGISVDP